MVIGISGDSTESHRNFKLKHRLPYSLLSDKENKVRKLFGAQADLLGFLPGRVTYVFDKQGIVRYIFNSQMGAEKHVTKALKIIKHLQE